MVALFGIALGPILLAWALYAIVSGNQPWASTNNGELLDPPLLVRTLMFADEDDEHGDGLSANWWLLIVDEDDCRSRDCAESMFLLRQLHVLLNRDASRVRRGLASTPVLPDADRRSALQDEYPRLHLFGIRAGALRAGVYIADPRGNLILYYRHDQVGEPVLEDLRRLLQASRIG